MSVGVIIQYFAAASLMSPHLPVENLVLNIVPDFFKCIDGNFQNPMHRPMRQRDRAISPTTSLYPPVPGQGA